MLKFTDQYDPPVEVVLRTIFTTMEHLLNETPTAEGWVAVKAMLAITREVYEDAHPWGMDF